MVHQEMSDAELAEYYYAHRDDPEIWGDQVDVAIPKRLDSVVSVRFNSAEIAEIQRAADEAGVSLSSFIRRSVLGAHAAKTLDLDRARRDMAQARRLVVDALRALHV